MSAPRAPAENLEVIVIGGGQAGLALGYCLRRHNRRFVIFDREPRSGS